MLSIRAGYFQLFPESVVAEVERVCREFAAAPPPGDFEVERERQTYRLTDCEWHAEHAILTGTMWKVRKTDLPSALIAGEARQVGSDLGESASFAYLPSRREALIQYNHHGPRHTVLAAFLAEMGIPGVVSIVPVIVQNAIARVQNAPIIRRFEYSLGNVGDETYLRGAGLGRVLDEMKAQGGTSIKVEVSLGHDEGGLASTIKEMGVKLIEAASGVKTVKVGIKENDEKATEMLDLLNGRLFIDMNIAEAGRELDRAECRTRLRVALKLRQTTSEESDDDEPEDDQPERAAIPEQPRAVLDSDQLEMD